MTYPTSPHTIPYLQRITTRTILSIVLLVILMVMIVGCGVIWIAYSEQGNTIHLTQKKTAEEVSLIISYYFSNLADNLMLLSTSSHFSTLSIKEQKEVLIDLLNDKRKLYHECTVLTPDGKEVLKLSRFYTYMPDELGNRSTESLFNRALKGETVISPIYVFPQTGLISVDIAIPVSDHQGAITHVLIGTASVLPLWSEIEKIDLGNSGYAYIVDKEGKFVAYQKISDILDRYGSLMTAYPPVQDVISEKSERTNISPYIGLKGEEVIGSYAEIEGTDWAVIIELSTTEAFENILRMIHVTIAALIIGALFSGLLGYVLSRYLTDPVLNLTFTVSKIGQGNLVTDIHEITRTDEIGILARGIEQMQKNLRESYLDLELRISELTLAREKLRISEEQYRTIFEHSENPLILVEKDFSISLINKKFEELWGYSQDEVIGQKKWVEFVADPEERNRMIEYNKRRQAGEKDIPSLYNFRFKTRYGEIRDIMISVTQMPGTGQTLATLVDVTEQKRFEQELIQKNSDLHEAYEKLAANEEELRESYNTLATFEQELRMSEQKYRSIVEDQTELILRFTPQRKIIFVNDAFCSFFQLNREYILQQGGEIQGIEEYLSGILNQITALSSDNPVAFFECRIFQPDGEERWINGTIRGLFDDSGSITEYQSVARDISDRKKAEEALEKARNKLTLLNAITFEDIRNYIFTLSGYLEVQKDMVSDPAVLTLFEKEKSIVKKVSQSLEFAKDYQDMGIKPAYWQNVLQVYLYAISHLDLTHIERVEEIKGVFMYADPLLEKVFFNLAMNLVIHGKNSVTRLHLYTEMQGNDLKIIFEDNGQGIPDEQKETLFQRRNDLKKGMGLYFVREVLAITGIRIQETGVFGQGARFELIVPYGKYRLE